MPIYALENLTPTLPEAGRVWVAPNAQVIGQVVPQVWLALRQFCPTLHPVRVQKLPLQGN